MTARNGTETYRIIIPESGRLTIYPPTHDREHTIISQPDRPASVPQDHALGAQQYPRPPTTSNTTSTQYQSQDENVRLRKHAAAVKRERDGLMMKRRRLQLDVMDLRAQLGKVSAEVEEWRKRYEAVAGDAGKGMDIGEGEMPVRNSHERDDLHGLKNQLDKVGRERDAFRDDCIRLKMENIEARRAFEKVVAEKKALEGEHGAKDDDNPGEKQDAISPSRLSLEREQTAKQTQTLQSALGRARADLFVITHDRDAWKSDHGRLNAEYGRRGSVLRGVELERDAAKVRLAESEGKRRALEDELKGVHEKRLWEGEAVDGLGADQASAADSRPAIKKRKAATDSGTLAEQGTVNNGNVGTTARRRIHPNAAATIQSIEESLSDALPKIDFSIRTSEWRSFL